MLSLAATSALRNGTQLGAMGRKSGMTGDAERRKRRKAAEAAAVSVEPTGATEAPEPPAAPDNSPEREVEPAVEPAAPDHPCLRHPDPEVRALAALQLKIEAEQSGTESKEEIELKVKMAWLARLADDYCVRVGDTERTKGLFGGRRPWWREEGWHEWYPGRWAENRLLWGEYNEERDGETEMELLRHRLACCRKKSGV